MNRIFLFITFISISLSSIAQPANSHPDTLLIHAIKKNDLAKVRSSLNQGANINAKDSNGVPALMWAAEVADLNLVKFLVEQGADITATGIVNQTGGLLNIAAKHCKLDMLRYLVETCKIDIDKKALSIETGQENGETPLQTAMYEVQTECVDYLRQMNADTTKVMSDVLSYYYDIGEFQKLVALSEKVMAQVTNEQGKNSEDYLFTLNTIALGHHEIGDYKKATELYLTLLKEIEHYIGKEGEEYTSVLGNLASLYHEVGQFDKSLKAYQEKLEIVEKVMGKDSYDAGLTLNNISVVYVKMGDYEKALSYTLKALEIAKNTQGNESWEYGIRLVNLGNVYRNMGAYEKALISETEAMDVIGKIRGTSHPDYGILVYNKASTYISLGEYGQAIPLLNEALAITEKSKGRIHQNTSSIISSIGLAYFRTGDQEKALEFLREAAEISKQAVGEENYMHGGDLHNLAFALSHMGEKEKALELYLKALEIKEKQLGNEHSSYISTLSNLGILYKQMGDHEKALKCHLEALKGFEKIFGKDHPKYGTELSNLAKLYEQTGDSEKAGGSWSEMNNNLLFQLQNRFPTLNEQLQTGYLRKLMAYYDRIQSHLLNHPGSPELTPATGYNNQLLLKGLLLENQGNLLASLRNQQDTASMLQYEQWQSMQRILARQYMKSLKSQHAFVDSLKKEVEKLELNLANNSALFRQARNLVKWKALQLELKEDEAAVEFSHFNYYDPKGQPTDSVVYVAYIVRPKSVVPELIYLFEEKELNALVNKPSQRRSDYVADLYAIADRGASAVKEHQKTLYELIWQPLTENMEGIHTVYFAPSGLLHRINLSAIPIDYDQTLGDLYNLHPRGNTRSLTYEVVEKSAMNDMAVLYGGVQFDMDSTTYAAINYPKKGVENEFDLLAATDEALFHEEAHLLGGSCPEPTGKSTVLNKLLLEQIFRWKTLRGSQLRKSNFNQLQKEKITPDSSLGYTWLFFSRPEYSV